MSTGARGQLTLETRGSKFIKYQELKLQELGLEVCLSNSSMNVLLCDSKLLLSMLRCKQVSAIG